MSPESTNRSLDLLSTFIFIRSSLEFILHLHPSPQPTPINLLLSPGNYTPNKTSLFTLLLFDWHPSQWTINQPPLPWPMLWDLEGKSSRQLTTTTKMIIAAQFNPADDSDQKRESEWLGFAPEWLDKMIHKIKINPCLSMAFLV